MLSEKRVFITLYSGDSFIFKIATHSSLYIEGDEYEWTYANSSEPTSTHGVTYLGIVYERHKKFLYGDWKYWKRVEVGRVKEGFCEGVDEKDALAAVRLKVKALAGAEKYVDGGYHFVCNNCWRFCYDTCCALGVELEPGFIEAFNDESHWAPKGTSRWALSWLSWFALVCSPRVNGCVWYEHGISQSHRRRSSVRQSSGNRPATVRQPSVNRPAIVRRVDDRRTIGGRFPDIASLRSGKRPLRGR